MYAKPMSAMEKIKQQEFFKYKIKEIFYILSQERKGEVKKE